MSFSVSNLSIIQFKTTINDYKTHVFRNLLLKLPLTARICVVRDFIALHYQTATWFIKCSKVQIY